ncbi:MAG TPA: TIR domain-containing protein [Thermoanaerobaculia bacterium]|nr:TIR domain-containing protein [Thermoanaerobaculia bacterium]
MDESEIPAGFRLRHTLSGHSRRIVKIAWSPDGTKIASASNDYTVRIWDAITGKCLRILKGHSKEVGTVTWSPDGNKLASGSRDMHILIWDVLTGKNIRWLYSHFDLVRAVDWSPDGRFLASGSNDHRVQISDASSWKSLQQFLIADRIPSVRWSPNGRFLATVSEDGKISLFVLNEESRLTQHFAGSTDRHVLDVTWSPNSELFATASDDSTIKIWEAESGKIRLILQGHTGGVISISFSADGSLLASKALDGTVRLWCTSTWQQIAVLPEPHHLPVHLWHSGLAFHPTESCLATLGEKDSIIRIWDLDPAVLLGPPSIKPVTFYTNAKVVLVGESGVGKSSLGIVLSGAPFAPMPSTHGRKVWTFSSTEAEIAPGRIEKRETLLWDLAGQPGYRLIHQLHLKEVALALVVFDARNEIDPFSGIQHWVRALKNAQTEESSLHPIKKFLVAARTDRGGIAASKSRIDSTLQEFGFDDYFETSAKESWNIRELTDAINSSIDWDKLSKVSSNELFQEIKDFLISEKQEGRLLSTIEDLYREFRRSRSLPIPLDLRPEFDLCIRLVEQRDLIHRLSFGGLVLLQPELLDAYASAIVNAARTEPDGLGSISEEAAKAGQFAMSKDERLQDKEQEKLLLITTIEDLLRHEIALREQADDGPYLVFPSQLTRENKDLPNPEGRVVAFRFEGAILNIYATLAVRLSHSGAFTRHEMWRNAITYTGRTQGICGMALKETDEGSGELTLFFDTATSEETRFQFEEYIAAHLRRRALRESIARHRFYSCPNCGIPVADRAAQRVRELGRLTINCYACDAPISLLDREERLAAIDPSLVISMDKAADERRNTEAAALVLQGKKETNSFDVFLCHNREDKGEVKKIGEILKQHGILPWLDDWELRPGFPWKTILEEQIGKIRAAAVFVGPTDVGPWQNLELQSFLDEFVKRNCPVIPVILESSSATPQLPRFLRGMTWVDFRQADPDPVEMLIWGITGERRSSLP